MTKRAGKNKKSPPETTEPQSPVSQQAIATSPSTPENSNWWGYLKPSVRARAVAMGGGIAEQVKTSQESRLELLAIKSRWPIPADLKASMVYENARMLIDPKADPRTRVNASRVLLAMEAMNQRDDKPDQIQVNVLNGDQVMQVNGADMLSQMRERWAMEDPRDSEFYIEPGSENDYAE